MAAVSPFRGWRFNQEKVGDMASVLCPPYDMIDEDIQDTLKSQNQYNVIHLEAGEGLDWNASAKGQYSATSDLFDRWRIEGVLQRTPNLITILCVTAFPLQGRTWCE